jgi:hypothetical protein
MTKIFTFLVGQSCCSALNSWAAQQRRPTEDANIFVLQLNAGAKSVVMLPGSAGLDSMSISLCTR